MKFSVCIQQCCNESPRDPVTSRVQCPIMSKQLSSEALLESCHFSYWTLVESMKIATRVDLSPSQDSLQDWYSVEIYIQSGMNYCCYWYLNWTLLLRRGEKIHAYSGRWSCYSAAKISYYFPFLFKQFKITSLEGIIAEKKDKIEELTSDVEKKVYQGRMFIFLIGGVGKCLVGCKRHPLSELRQGLGVKVKDFHIK